MALNTIVLRAALLGFSLVGLTAASARAESDWEVELGGGLGVSPEFPGSADADLSFFPYGDVEYKDRFFISARRGLGVRLLEGETGILDYELGIAVGPEFTDRDADDAPGLPEVDKTALARLFGEVTYRHFQIEADLAQDILFNGHDGFVSEIAAGYGTRFLRGGFVSVGPFVRLAGGDYMESFYSVAPDVAEQAGLTAFDADAGLESAGIRLFAAWHFSRQWVLFSAARYGRLVGDAADSPIVEDEDQVSVLTAIGYRF